MVFNIKKKNSILQNAVKLKNSIYNSSIAKIDPLIKVFDNKNKYTLLNDSLTNDYSLFYRFIKIALLPK